MMKSTIGGRESVALAASLLGMAVLFLLGTMQLTGEARIVPLSILVPLLPLLGYILWRTAKTPASRVSPSVTSDHADARLILGWILALPALVTMAGLIAGAALYVTLWLRNRSRERWTVSIVWGVVTALVLWLLGATVLEGLPRIGPFQFLGP